jgi:hypothetical protein
MKLPLLGGLAGGFAYFLGHQIVRHMNKSQFSFNDFLK